MTLSDRRSIAALAFPAVMVLGTITAAVLGGCGTPSHDETPTAAPVTVTVTAMPKPGLSVTQNDAAIKEYFNPERRQKLQDALDRVGRGMLDRMLGGPAYKFRAWNKVDPAPVNGFGSVVSLPSEGPVGPDETFTQVNVHFVNGKVDTAMGPLGIFIIHKGFQIQLDGLTTLHGPEGNPVQNAPDAYGWRYNPVLQDKFGDNEHYLWLTSESGTPLDSDKPVVSCAPLGTSCKIMAAGYGRNYADADLVKQADNDFLAMLDRVYSSM